MSLSREGDEERERERFCVSGLIHGDVVTEIYDSGEIGKNKLKKKKENITRDKMEIVVCVRTDTTIM